MAITVYQPGSTPATYGAFHLEWKDRLKTLGHTVTKSGTGAAYSSSGDLITSAALMGTNLAHWEMVLADGSMGFWFQQIGAASNNARIKVCFGGDTFSAGSPSATQVGATASASDEFVLKGGGTDAAPTGGGVIQGSVNDKDLVVIADDEPPYGFVILGLTNTAIPHFAFIYDPMSTDSYDALDIAPMVIAQVSSSSAGALSSTMRATTACAAGWIQKGLGGSIVRVPQNGYRDGTDFSIPDTGGSSGVGRNQYNGKVQLFPMVYARRDALGAPYGTKGVSNMLAWVGSAEATGTLLSTPGETNNWIVFEQFAIRWDGVSALIDDQSGGATLDAEYVSFNVYGADTGGTPPPPLDPTPDGAPRRIRGPRVRRRR